MTESDYCPLSGDAADDRHLVPANPLAHGTDLLTQRCGACGHDQLVGVRHKVTGWDVDEKRMTAAVSVSCEDCGCVCVYRQGIRWSKP